MHTYALMHPTIVAISNPHILKYICIIYTYIVFRMCYSCQYYRRKHTRSRKSRASNPTTFRLYRPIYMSMWIYHISNHDTDVDYLCSLSNLLVTPWSIFLTDTVSELSWLYNIAHFHWSANVISHTFKNMYINCNTCYILFV